MRRAQDLRDHVLAERPTANVQQVRLSLIRLESLRLLEGEERAEREAGSRVVSGGGRRYRLTRDGARLRAVIGGGAAVGDRDALVGANRGTRLAVLPVCSRTYDPGRPWRRCDRTCHMPLQRCRLPGHRSGSAATTSRSNQRAYPTPVHRRSLDESAPRSWFQTCHHRPRERLSYICASSLRSPFEQKVRSITLLTRTRVS